MLSGGFCCCSRWSFPKKAIIDRRTVAIIKPPTVVAAALCRRANSDWIFTVSESKLPPGWVGLLLRALNKHTSVQEKGEWLEKGKGPEI